MNISLLRASLIVFVAAVLCACSDAPFETAEKSLVEVHRELKSRTSQRDSTESGIQHSLSKLADYRKQLASAQFHQIAKMGDAGTSEQLIVAKKMLDDPMYERKLMDNYAAGRRDAADALEHIKQLQERLPQEHARVREYLPMAKTALSKYEDALQAEALSRGKRPSTSFRTDAIVREIKKELEDDVRRSNFEKSELELQSNTAKR